MSISLIIERPQTAPNAAISLEEWKEVVASDSDLRLRSEPYVAVNPVTGETITVSVGEADAEMRDNGEWVPFLRFRNGDLVCRYNDELEDPANPVRKKIAHVAKQLGAVITTDAGDELLNW